MEAKLKHLEFIQAVIARMATNSSLIRGWTITIVAALSAFAAANSRVALLAISIISTLMFWGLDGYYLWLERAFIALHAKVAVKEESDIDFSMVFDKSDSFSKWLEACLRRHLVAFYGCIILIEAIGIFVIKRSK